MVSRTVAVPPPSMWDSWKSSLGCGREYRQALEGFLAAMPNQVAQFSREVEAWKGKDLPYPKKIDCDSYVPLYDLKEQIASRDWEIISQEEQRIAPSNCILRTIWRVFASTLKWWTGISQLELQYQGLATQFSRSCKELEIGWKDFKSKVRGIVADGFKLRFLDSLDGARTVIVERDPFKQGAVWDQMILTRTASGTVLLIEKVMVQDPSKQEEVIHWVVQLAIEELLRDGESFINCVQCGDMRFEEILQRMGFAKVGSVYTLTRGAIERVNWPTKITAKPILPDDITLFH